MLGVIPSLGRAWFLGGDHLYSLTSSHNLWPEVMLCCWLKCGLIFNRFQVVECSKLQHDQVLDTTVDGWNPANQLRLVVYPIVYRVLYIAGGCLGFPPSTVCGGNSNISYFHPANRGKMNPFWRAYFSNGLVQPPTRIVCENGWMATITHLLCVY